MEKRVELNIADIDTVTGGKFTSEAAKWYKENYSALNDQYLANTAKAFDIIDHMKSDGDDKVYTLKELQNTLKLYGYKF